MAEINAAEIDKVLEIAPAKLLTVEGFTFIDKGAKASLFVPPTLTGLAVYTLTGFIDLCEARFEAFAAGDVIVHVATHERVDMLSRLSDVHGRRALLFQAMLAKPEREFKFNTFYKQEDFIISLRSLFIQDSQLDDLVRVAGNLAHRAEIRQEDDGFTQSATMKTGVVIVKERTILPRVSLTPFRTFREAAQPSTEYVFRVRGDEGGTTCALFEADGGVWKLQAIQNVKEYLQNQLRGANNELALIPVIA